MKVPKGKTSFKDIVHGKVIFDNKDVDDQVILKNDGYPTYHFANIVDDYLMQISHVIRGEVSSHLYSISYIDFDCDRSGCHQPPSTSSSTECSSWTLQSSRTCHFCSTTRGRNCRSDLTT